MIALINNFIYDNLVFITIANTFMILGVNFRLGKLIVFLIGD